MQNDTNILIESLIDPEAVIKTVCGMKAAAELSGMY